MSGLGRVARMGERRGAHKVLVVKPEANKPLGIAERKRVDCSKVYLQETGLRGEGGDVDWIYLAHDRDRRRALSNAKVNLRIHLVNKANLVHNFS